MNDDDELYMMAVLQYEQQGHPSAQPPTSGGFLAASVAAPSGRDAAVTPGASSGGAPQQRSAGNETPSFFLPRPPPPRLAMEAEVEEVEEARRGGAALPEAKWFFPESQQFPRRTYQYEMVASCLRGNTLVCLPTGLGKTFVAAVVMFNFYKWHPNRKVVFLAPTKPLVAQQVEACYSVMGIPYSDISEMTGRTPPAKRHEEWLGKRCFFVTPQVLQNDLSRGSVDPASVCCLVVDEAHRARGSYAYVHVVRTIAARTKQFRVVGLTATPAKTMGEVQDVVDNLLVSRLQVRSDGDIDVSRYVHTKTVEKIVVKLPAEIVRIKACLDDQITKHLKLLCSQQAFFTVDAAKVCEFTLLQAQQKWAGNTGGQQVGLQQPTNNYAGKSGMVFAAFAQARFLAQGRKLLVVHGLVPFLDFCRAKRAETPAKRKTMRNLVDSPEFGQAFGLAQKAVDAGLQHPKVTELLRLLDAHFSRDIDSRVVVFTTFRDSVESIVAAVGAVAGVRASRFVGQANRGQKQVEQLDVITRFRQGDLNTLVATCVGEEGLDVGECDLIVLFDTSSSPIRTMQRMGRTGRKRQGRCVSLLTEGAEENQYDRSRSTGSNILGTLLGNKDKFRFYAPRPEEVDGLVPGRIARPEICVAAPPDVSIQDARRVRKERKKKPVKAKRKRGKANEEEEEDFELYEPSDVWFSSPKARRVEEEEEDDEEEEEEEEGYDDNGDAEPEEGEFAAADQGEINVHDDYAADDDLVFDSPSPPRRPVSPLALPPEDDHPVAQFAPPPPPASAPSFKPPTPKAQSSARHLTADANELIDAIPQDMRHVLLRASRAPVVRGLFLPPAPSLKANALVVSRRIECGVCGMPFPDDVTLGLHCVDRHWPKDEFDSVSPTPRTTLLLSQQQQERLRRDQQEQPLRSAPSPMVPPTGSAQQSSSSPSPSIVTSVPASQLEVVEILDSRLAGGEREFLVRLRGCSIERATWEPEARLCGSGELLKEFLQRQRPRDVETAAAKEPQGKKPRRAAQKKKKKPSMSAAAFLDLEAGLSGSDEVSSDEEEEEEDENGVRRSSWLVSDDADIIYSGSPPSQPHNDAAFYRRFANAASDADSVTPVALTKRARKRVATESRAKRPAPGGQCCAVCKVPAEGGLCESCAALRPCVVAASTTLKLACMQHLETVDKVVLSDMDASLVLGLDRAVVLVAEAALRNSAGLLGTLQGALERNHSVVLIVESSPDQGFQRRGNPYEATMARLCSLARLTLLVSFSALETAGMIKELFALAKDVSFSVSANWMRTRDQQLKFLCQVPHVGVGRAIALLQAFGSLGSVVAASSQQVAQVLGGGLDGRTCEQVWRHMNA